METQTWLIVLRLVHIVAGVFWVGAALLITIFLLPSIRAAGPAGGEVMQQLTQIRHLPRYLEVATVLTLASGVLLYWHMSGGFHFAWFRSDPGLLFGGGGLLAILAGTLGFTVNAPTARRMGSLGAAIRQGGGPPTPEQAAELQRLQVRMFRASQLSAVLLVLSTAAMAVARYA
jgi:hypothetical protein